MSILINGRSYTVDLSALPPDITLNTYLRQYAQLTATKFMCLEGGCGVCTCVLKRKNPTTNAIEIKAVNSCLTFLNSVLDCEVVTQEGIGDKLQGYHPIQKRLAELNGSQCGYCSSGFVMNMYALHEGKNGNLTEEEIENSFGGNLCRCTGYRPILDAMKSFAIDSAFEVVPTVHDIEELNLKKMCPKTGLKCLGNCLNPLEKISYEDGTSWYYPKTLEELFDILGKINTNDYMLVGGNTANGVYRRPKNIQTFINLREIKELHGHSLEGDKLTLKSNTTLTEAMDIFQETKKTPGFEYLSKVWDHFDLIANIPVRNMGTLAGNIATKKAYMDFPSDVFLIFEALDVTVMIRENAATEKSITLMEYLKNDLGKSIISAFQMKAYPKDKYIYQSYKIMPRAQNARAYVNAAFLIGLDTTGGQIDSARIVFGGISPNFAHAIALETFLKGKNLYDPETVTKAFPELDKDIQPLDILPEPSPEYRKKVSSGLFYKFLLSIVPPEKIKEEFKSGGQILKRILSSGSQTFETNKKFYPVSQAVRKLEGLIQCSGEATYMNDMLTTDNTLYCAFVSATKVGATIDRIDASDALKEPGVVAFYQFKDIPGQNSYCDSSVGYVQDEIFVENVVKYYNQPLGLIVATTSDIAKHVVDKVKVIYSKTRKSKLAFSMDDVFLHKMNDRIFITSPSKLKDIELSDKADVKGSGFLQLGLQYHFPLEPQTTIAVPFENGLQVWCATQWMDHTQVAIAKMLKLPVNAVQLKVRRLGGGFGIKISRGNLVACAASLAAFKLNRPVRFVQTIESMMDLCGKRWACRSEYEFHAKANGKIVGLKNIFYQDAGINLNENPVANHTIPNVKNCYQFTETNAKFEGNAVITDAASSTWCRAPGSVEGIAMMETIIEHIAFECKLDPVEVRLINLPPNHKLLQLLPRFLESTEYRERRKEIDEFNLKNRWRKRGLGLSIMQYAVFYAGNFPATVSIYHGDGTVVISHGGIEMGQGINTKAAQVAAYILGVDLSFIKVESSDTIVGANAEVTGGAVGSESVCFAVRKACKTLIDRLAPLKNSLPKTTTWPELIQKAFERNIQLIASEQHKAGDMPEYSVYGLTATEMEVDILTGQYLIKKVHLLEDAGESLSPLVDVGQVEGAFVLALGYWLSENLVYDRQTGELLTNRTWTYKVPGAKDIPIDFRVELLQNNPNSGGFMRSKATGEPPCCMAISAIFALQHALQSARSDAGLPREWIRLGAPTTGETIVKSAGHDDSQFVLN